MLEVVEPGLLTTVQDAGRPDWTHLGVPVGGAADPWSLAVANLLVGADAGAAGLEMTIVGPTLGLAEATTIGLAGADLGGVVQETGRRLLPGRSHALATGSTVMFPGGDGGGGARAYLAVPGGLDVPVVLGSASTLISASLGGLGGRALVAGDVLRGRAAGGEPPAERSWPWLDDDPLAALTAPGPLRLRVVAGPAAGAEALLAVSWRVRSDSDRVGLRLEAVGDRVDQPVVLGTGELLTHGVVRGAIQLPPGGGPVVLMADGQTTGGYPVIAVIVRADHPLLGQLRPGALIRFEAMTPDEARAALLAQQGALERGAAACGGDDRWDELWQSAGR